MTQHEAKELTLEVWRYLADHPEIEGKRGLPQRLYNKIKKCLWECPLCEYVKQTVKYFLLHKEDCKYCPLDVPGNHSSCKLYDDWNNAFNTATRKEAAQAIVNKIEAWEPEVIE